MKFFICMDLSICIYIFFAFNLKYYKRTKNGLWCVLFQFPKYMAAFKFFRVSALNFILEFLDLQCIFLHVISCFQTHTIFTPCSSNAPLQLPLLSEAFKLCHISRFCHEAGEIDINHVGSPHTGQSFINK